MIHQFYQMIYLLFFCLNCYLVLIVSMNKTFYSMHFDLKQKNNICACVHLNSESTMQLDEMKNK